MNTETWIMLAGLLTTTGGLIWGAAKIAAAVSNLDNVVERLITSVDRLEKTVNHLDTRVTVLEDRHDREEVAR